MYLMNLSMDSFQEKLVKVKAGVLPVGMIEAHGRHRPLGTDMLIPFPGTLNFPSQVLAGDGKGNPALCPDRRRNKNGPVGTVPTGPFLAVSPGPCSELWVNSPLGTAFFRPWKKEPLGTVPTGPF
jgi:hypothetical protein